MPLLKRLLYAGLEVSDTDVWQKFCPLFYETELVKNSAGEYELPIDETGCRLIFSQGGENDIVTAGFEVDEGALDTIISNLEKYGAPITEAGAEHARLRYAERVVTTEDPNGLKLDFVVGNAGGEHLPPPSVKYIAGDLGMGHLTMMAGDFDKVSSFYTDVLDFKLTDLLDWEVKKGMELHIGFYRTNARHHSVALARMPGDKRLHHFMLQLPDTNAVGIAYDRVRNGGVPIVHNVGVHPQDGSFTFYARSPSGFQVELGAGGEELHVDREVRHHTEASIWGHDMPSAS